MEIDERHDFTALDLNDEPDDKDQRHALCQESAAIEEIDHLLEPSLGQEMSDEAQRHDEDHPSVAREQLSQQFRMEIGEEP